MDVFSKSHLYQHGALGAVLTVTITDAEEVLMEGLAHIGSQDEVVLVFFVGVMNREAFSCAVGKTSYNVIFYYFGTFVLLIFFYPKWTVSCIGNSVMIVDPLISETQWRWDHPRRYQSLYRSR